MIQTANSRFSTFDTKRNIGFISGVYTLNKLTGLTRLLCFSWRLSVAHNVTTGPDDVTGLD